MIFIHFCLMGAARGRVNTWFLFEKVGNYDISLSMLNTVSEAYESCTTHGHGVTGNGHAHKNFVWLLSLHV